MNAVRIVATPPGEAPEDVRGAWVGLVLPLYRHRRGKPRRIYTAGVLSGPRGVWAAIWAILTGRTKTWFGYTVPAPDAIDLLEAANPDAAAWWRQNTPHLVEPGRFLVFPAEVCEIVAPEPS